jgi:endonuclease/exonuclease/phosphatase family metal-dependent hydrolase
MGDFNAGWGEKSPLRTLAEALVLKAYKPNEKGNATFPMTNKRIDWILISNEMDFLSYQVLPNSISDHKAVLAELIWRSYTVDAARIVQSNTTEQQLTRVKKGK